MTGVSEQMHIYLTSAAYVKMDFFLSRNFTKVNYIEVSWPSIGSG